MLTLKFGLSGYWSRRIDREHRIVYKVVADDLLIAQQGGTQIQLPDLKELKGWAKSHGWPTPWFGFKDAFVAKLFESNETFTLALNESGVTIHIPIKEHTLTLEMLRALDALYEEREDMGALGRRPTGWGTLVSELREIRRLVEAGVVVKIAGTETVLTTWQSFYTWGSGLLAGDPWSVSCGRYVVLWKRALW